MSQADFNPVWTIPILTSDCGYRYEYGISARRTDPSQKNLPIEKRFSTPEEALKYYNERTMN